MSRLVSVPPLPGASPSLPTLLGGAALLAAVTHLALLGVLIQAGALLLAAANVGSVLLYLAVWLLARLGLGRQLTQSLMGAEVLANAVLCVLLLGWNSEFAACLSAILALVAAFSMAKGRQRLVSTFLIVGLYGSLALLNTSSGLAAQAGDVSGASYALHLFNLACVLLLPASSGGLYQRLVAGAMSALHQARTIDKESGLPNHDSIARLLSHNLRAAGYQNYPESMPTVPMSAVMVVLDARQVGRSTPDRHALREAAQALRKGLRAGDSIGRWGSHRFLVLLPDSDAAAARIVTERMRALVGALEWRSPTNGELRPPIGLLMGVAPAIAGDEAEDLIERCESALRASRTASKRRSNRQPTRSAA